MSLYDDVLNCPDTHCRKKALDALCLEKMAEGMEIAANVIDAKIVGGLAEYMKVSIRQAAKELNDEL